MKCVTSGRECWTLLYYNHDGRTVEIPGIGSFQPLIQGDGRIRVSFRPAAAYLNALDNLKRFEGEIANAENVGLSPQGYKALWDAEHPEDPMEMPLQAA